MNAWNVTKARAITGMKEATRKPKHFWRWLLYVLGVRGYGKVPGGWRTWARWTARRLTSPLRPR